MDFKRIIELLNRLKFGGWQEFSDQSEKVLLDAWNDKSALLSSIRDEVALCSPSARSRHFLFDAINLYEGDHFYIRLHHFRVNPIFGHHPNTNRESLHNHTGAFISLCLSGGYDSVEHWPSCSFEELKAGQPYNDVHEEPGPTTYPGFVHTISPNLMHRITRFEEGTLTLIVCSKEVINRETTIFSFLTETISKVGQGADILQSIIDDLNALI